MQMNFGIKSVLNAKRHYYYYHCTTHNTEIAVAVLHFCVTGTFFPAGRNQDQARRDRVCVSGI